MTKCKCEIQWIDGSGNDTADSNDAVGVAILHTCHNDGSRHMSRPYAICEAHARRAPGLRGYEPGRFATLLSTEWEVVRGFGNIVALAKHNRAMGRLDMFDALMRAAHAIAGTTYGAVVREVA